MNLSNSPKDLMSITILFGGVNRERLVAVASAQAVVRALPEADLWYWAANGQVYAAARDTLLNHERPFEIDLPIEGEAIGDIDEAISLAAREERTLLLSLHGGMAENGELQALCEAKGVAFTGSGAAASRVAFDKPAAKAAVAAAGVLSPQGVALADAPEALARYGRLVAKPAADGSSYGLIFVDGPEDLERLATAARAEAYVIEPFVVGRESTCGVLERADGSLLALPPVEILPAEGVFDYAAKYLSAGTRELCPSTFSAETVKALQALALKAHVAVGAAGYSRSDFIITDNGPVFLEINTLPGMTASSLYPKSLAAEGLAFDAFLRGQVSLAVARAEKAAAA